MKCKTWKLLKETQLRINLVIHLKNIDIKPCREQFTIFWLSRMLMETRRLRHSTFSLITKKYLFLNFQEVCVSFRVCICLKLAANVSLVDWIRLWTTSTRQSELRNKANRKLRWKINLVILHNFCRTTSRKQTH